MDLFRYTGGQSAIDTSHHYTFVTDIARIAADGTFATTFAPLVDAQIRIPESPGCLFVSRPQQGASFDLHLDPGGSPGICIDPPASTVSIPVDVDIDGRDRDATPDVGADEVP